MILNFILALTWLALAIGAFFYMLIHPGGRLHVFGKELHVVWVVLFALVMFGFRLVRWWLSRVQRRAKEAMKRSSVRTNHLLEEPNPDFDFSDGPEKRDA